MDNVIRNLDGAKRQIKTADYMLTMTYETVKEPKLLLTIISTVFQATKKAILASLQYERHFKRIHPFNEDSFEAQLDLFKKALGTKYGMVKEDYEFINYLRKVNQEHKESAVEFSRKDNYFIFDDNYSAEKLDKEDVKKTILNAKVFIDKIYHVINNKK